MSLFGGQSLFNTPQSTASKPIGSFGFGTTTTQSQPLGSFSTATTKPLSLFGSAPATSQPFQSSTNAPLFGVNQPATSTTNQLNFGSGLRTTQQPFGSTFASQQNQLQHAPAPAANNVDSLFASLSKPAMFGDERDQILVAWNRLQAVWGHGTGYSSLGAVNYSPDNVFARFKSIAYNVLFTSSDEDGLVCLYLKRPFSQIEGQRQAIYDVLFRLIVSANARTNMQLVIEELRPNSQDESMSEVIFKVTERQTTGSLTNVSATQLANYLSTPNMASQLQSQLAACKVIAEVSPSALQLASYHEHPPMGIDRMLWQQARLDNPQPDRMLPVPLIGFSELKRRRQDQLIFFQQQNEVVRKLNQTVVEMRDGQLVMAKKLNMLKRKELEIGHRLLKVLSQLEVNRKRGLAISAQEEVIRSDLERVWSELSSTRGLRNRFQDVCVAASDPAVHMEKTFQANQEPNWNLNPEAMPELKEYLSQRQVGIRELQNVLTDLMDTVKLLEGRSASSFLQQPSNRLLPTGKPNKVAFALGFYQLTSV